MFQSFLLARIRLNENHFLNVSVNFLFQLSFDAETRVDAGTRVETGTGNRDTGTDDGGLATPATR